MVQSTSVVQYQYSTSIYSTGTSISTHARTGSDAYRYVPLRTYVRTYVRADITGARAHRYIRVHITVRTVSAGYSSSTYVRSTAMYCAHSAYGVHGVSVYAVPTAVKYVYKLVLTRLSSSCKCL